MGVPPSHAIRRPWNSPPAATCARRGNARCQLTGGAVPMTKLCEGRVAIVTGAGRGIGREHSLLLAHHGAKVVVNDLGGAMDGEGNDKGPAQSVVDEIVALGGEAVANTDDISDWDGAERLVRTAIDTFGGLDILINNAGILRDRMLTNMRSEERRVGKEWVRTFKSRLSP